MLSMCSLSVQSMSAMPALRWKHSLPAGPVYYADEHHGGETQKRIDEEVTKLLKGAYSRVETLLVGCEFCCALHWLPGTLDGGVAAALSVLALCWPAPQQRICIQATRAGSSLVYVSPLLQQGEPKPGGPAHWPPVLCGRLAPTWPLSV